MSRTLRWSLMIAALVAAVGIAWLIFMLNQPAYAFEGGEYEPAAPAPPLNLTTQHGEPFALSDLEGNVTLIYFGYTTCPDYCPTTISNFTVVKELLGEDADRVKFVLVTFDPERDTPERLRQYLSFFDEEFIGLRGDEKQTEQVLKDYGITVIRVDQPESATEYLLDHSTRTYVIDPEGRLRLSFSYELPPESMAADIRALLND